MRLAIMGAGSLGTIAGAFLAKEGMDPILIDVNKAHVDALNQKGATIVGKAEFTVPVKAITPEQMEGVYDVVLYFTKQTHNAVALPQLLPHLGPDSIVCTLQNGIPEPKVAEIVGEERTIGAPVGWPATWEGPGVSRLNMEREYMYFDIGAMPKTKPGAVAKVAEVLRKICTVHELSDLMGARWTKLWINSVWSGMSVVIGDNYEGVMNDPLSMRAAMFLGNEIFAVTRAAKIELGIIMGDYYVPSLEFFSERDIPAKEYLYKLSMYKARLTVASMLQDIQKGYKTEIDAIDGAVSEMGRKGGVPTPVHDQLVAIVKGMENGTHKPCLENSKLFVFPEIPY